MKYSITIDELEKDLVEMIIPQALTDDGKINSRDILKCILLKIIDLDSRIKDLE
jgi:hypothetical protein